MLLKEKWGKQEVIWETKDFNNCGCLNFLAPFIGMLIMLLILIISRYFC